MTKLFKRTTYSILSITLTLSLSACSYAANQTLNKNTVNTGYITDKEIPEASGLAISQRQKNVLWVLNDSGNKPWIFAINEQGERLGTVKIKGVKNKDWEDLASFKYQGKPYLLIADVGDNSAKRKKYFLHFIKEPKANKLSPDEPLSVKPEWSIEFTYEDGPRDCESVALDLKNNKILLLSKRDKPPVLYELPMRKSDKKEELIAQKLGDIKPLPEPEVQDVRALKNLFYAKRPTAMDMSADGSALIVLTYVKAYLYQNKTRSNWASVLAQSPKEIDLPYLQQGESICFDHDGQSIYVTSEGLPAPLFKVDLKDSLH
ncbi:hypothetical protein [Thiomicrorhabdus sp.]|uniref:hypothetical protein n=1 Tax=Thiomicrorhabdus sp. TaxID=2039724 RepID=UPI0029C943A2|nr:hypothetical protein [Thiomicrorhabdus sp.]